MSARRAALSALMAVEQGGAYSSAATKKAVKDFNLTGADVGLCHQITFGVLQNRLYLDFLLAKFSSVKPKKMEIKLLQILRLSLYQLLFLDKVPSYAVLDEAVTLTRKNTRNPKASGLVNAVLRAIEREKHALPVPESLSVQYSHPQELVDHWTQELGAEKTEAILAANQKTAAIRLQVNSLYTSEDELLQELTQAGVTCEATQQGLVLRNSGKLEELSAFQRGLFYVQDAAARKAVSLAGAKPGMHVLDLCAAPGGKSFSLAMDMQDQGSILSCDIHTHKIQLLKQSIARLNIKCITPTLSDATQLQKSWLNQFDLVFADVPCSGLGIIRKRPEIRYKKLEDLAQLPQIQQSILEHAIAYAKPGATVLYATCTILRRENEAVVEAVLAQGNAELVEMETLYPCDGDYDGFFMAKLRKK